MARIYGHPTAGTIERIDRNEAATARYGAPAPGLVALDLDEDTNAALVEDLHANRRAYRLAGGALTKAGQAVAIAPADADTVAGREVGDRRQVAELLADLAAARDSLDGAANLAAIRPVLKLILRALRAILVRLSRSGA